MPVHMARIQHLTAANQVCKDLLQWQLLNIYFWFVSDLSFLLQHHWKKKFYKDGEFYDSMISGNCNVHWFYDWNGQCWHRE